MAFAIESSPYTVFHVLIELRPDIDHCVEIPKEKEFFECFNNQIDFHDSPQQSGSHPVRS